MTRRRRAICATGRRAAGCYAEVPNGPGLPGSRFPSPHGAFFAIDGHCHYYATANNQDGIHTGDLSLSQAARLASDLQLASLSRFTSATNTCFDADLAILASAAAAFGCTCGDCASDQPASSALARAQDWLQRMAAAGTPLPGDVRALAIPSLSTGCYRPHFFDWPLARPLAQIDGLIQTGRDPTLEGVLFDDPAEVASLRQLRAAASTFWLAQGVMPWDIWVADQDAHYRLFLRDVLPADASAAIDDFIMHAYDQVDGPAP
jgi:hypothetical protein